MSHGLLAATRVVLIHPSLPENVGAVSRAMAHFGLGELVLVGGVSPRHSLAIAASAGQQDALMNALVVDDLETALKDCVVAFGTTARSQLGSERRVVLPAEGAELAASHAHAGPVALVFGTEKHGMSNADLGRCDQLITIPGTVNACLNLAQAFTVLAYEWRMASEAAPAEPTEEPLYAAIREAGLPSLAKIIMEALAKAGAVKAQNYDSKLHVLQRLLSRTRLTLAEAAMLRGLAHAFVARGPDRRAEES